MQEALTGAARRAPVPPSQRATKPRPAVGTSSPRRPLPGPKVARQEPKPEIKGRPAKKPAASKSRTSDVIGGILDDIDSTFDNILSDPTSVSQAQSSDDLQQAQELFRQITGEYVGPIRDFLVELKMGEPSKEWISVCASSVASLYSSAKQMGMGDLALALDEIGRALQKADKASGNLVSGAPRDEILKKAEPLERLLPEAFALDQERDRREPIIVRSLLCQVEGVRKVQLDKIYRAGLTTLKMFYLAKASEVAETTGLDAGLSEKIVGRFARYRREMASAPPDTDRKAEVDQLKGVADEIKSLTEAYDQRVSVSRELSASDRRKIRKRREELMLQADMLLARLGEVGLVQRLERLPFQRKTEELLRFVKARSQAKTN